MLKLYGSYNSRFYASLTGNEVRLYRGISAGAGLTQNNEAAPVYSKSLDPSLHLEIVRVSNQGDLFFRAPSGLYRLRNAAGSNLEVASATVCALARGEEPGKLGKVLVDCEGRGIFYEVITPEGGLKDKFFKLLGGKKSSGESLLAHQVVYYDVATQRTMNFPATLVDSKREFPFHWNLAHGGRFLVQARPEKKSYQLEVIDVTDESFFEFKMALAHIEDLWVNDAGVMMVDVRQVGEEKLIIALPDRSTPRQVITPPPSYRAVHLGPLHVSVTLEAQRKLQIYEYEGKLVADVDLHPLHQLGVDYHFNFNERGDIDVLAYRGGSLNIQHSTVKSILTDAKRWAMTARQKEAEEEEFRLREVTQQHAQERRRLEDQQLSRQLADAVVTDFPVSPAAPPRIGHPSVGAPAAPPPPLPGIPNAPLPSRPVETPPWAAALGTSPQPAAPPAHGAAAGSSLPSPGQALPPLDVPSSLPSPNAFPSVDVPSSLPIPGVAPESGATRPPVLPPTVEPPGPPPEPMVPPRPAPSAAPPPTAAPPTSAPSITPPVLPPSPAAELPFLRGAAPLPPPDTETEEPLPPPPVPASLPDAATQTEDTGDFADVAAVDAELERLRMSYIAGEISREKYYTRRAELEAVRKNLQSPSGATTGPKRLDLELEPGNPPSSPSPELSGPPRRDLPSLQIPLTEEE